MTLPTSERRLRYAKCADCGHAWNVHLYRNEQNERVRCGANCKCKRFRYPDEHYAWVPR